MVSTAFSSSPKPRRSITRTSLTLSLTITVSGSSDLCCELRILGYSVCPQALKPPPASTEFGCV